MLSASLQTDNYNYSGSAVPLQGERGTSKVMWAWAEPDSAARCWWAELGRVALVGKLGNGPVGKARKWGEGAKHMRL